MTTVSADESLLSAVFAANDDKDLHDAYAELRRRAPVLRTRTGVVVLSRYADIQAALRDRRLGKTGEPLQSCPGLADADRARAALGVWQRTVLFSNPPGHTRLRRLIGNEFTPRHVERLRASITADVDDLLDRFLEPGGGEFMSGVARPRCRSVSSPVC